MKHTTYKPLYILFGIVVIAQIIIGFTTYISFESWSDRGTFGDMFGGVNALFSGLAFAGVIYAIFLQSKELELQREELRLTREELNKSASAQSNQVVIMEATAKLNTVSATINAYCQIEAGAVNGSTTQAMARIEREKLLKYVNDYIESEIKI